MNYIKEKAEERQGKELAVICGYRERKKKYETEKQLSNSSVLFGGPVETLVPKSCRSEEQSEENLIGAPKAAIIDTAARKHQ